MGYKLTKQEIRKEIIKCGKDPVYFINNYARIAHPIEGLIPFKTYDYQGDLINSFNDHRFTVILKGKTAWYFNDYRSLCSLDDVVSSR